MGTAIGLGFSAGNNREVTGLRARGTKRGMAMDHASQPFGLTKRSVTAHTARNPPRGTETHSVTRRIDVDE
jgi:hypothetical protein